MIGARGRVGRPTHMYATAIVDDKLEHDARFLVEDSCSVLNRARRRRAGERTMKSDQALDVVEVRRVRRKKVAASARESTEIYAAAWKRLLPRVRDDEPRS